MTENITAPIADENTDLTVDTGTPTPQEAGRTFTQDEVNRIVQDRLAKERNKLSPPPLSEKELELAEREKKLAQREFEQAARDILDKHKLSDKLLTVLNVSDADGLTKALDILDEEFDFKEEGPRIYYKNPDDTWTRHKRGDPVPRAVASTTHIGQRSAPDPIRQGMGLNWKET